MRNANPAKTVLLALNTVHVTLCNLNRRKTAPSVPKEMERLPVDNVIVTKGGEYWVVGVFFKSLF